MARKVKRTRHLNVIEASVALLLLVYPTLMLTIRGGMNGALLLMLLLFLLVWMHRPNDLKPMVWHRDWTLYVLAMFSLSVAIVISQSFNQNFLAPPHDAPSRYWLAIPVFLLLVQLRPRVFSVVQLAFPIAAIAGLLMSHKVGGRSELETLDQIHFGNFELILGALSLGSLGWLGRDRLPLLILKISGLVAGVSASLASGTRGGWMAIPVLMMILIYFRKKELSPKIVITAMMSIILAGVLLYTVNATFHQRVDAFRYDLVNFNQGNPDTSSGIRWQLYNAAIEIFVLNPVVGVGPTGFAEQMGPMQEAGKLTPLAAEIGRGEVHSDLLSKTVGMGVPGMLSMLAIYLVPFRLFWRAARSPYRQVRGAGIMGATFISGFMVFGLTAETLNLTMATAFYSFTIAVLLAACYNFNYHEQSGKPMTNEA